jgi:hypothetical protein
MGVSLSRHGLFISHPKGASVSWLHGQSEVDPGKDGHYWPIGVRGAGFCISDVL